MVQFKDIFNTITYRTKINFKKFVEVRRAKMIAEGFNVNGINWELYAKVLEVKHENLKSI